MVGFFYVFLYVMFFKVKQMNLMKLARHLLGVLGFSTLHLHNYTSLEFDSFSKVVPPLESKSLLAEAEKQHKKDRKFDFKIITIEKNASSVKYAHISNNQNNDGWVRPPRSIKATHKPRYPQ
jgi:hypothetical protein